MQSKEDRTTFYETIDIYTSLVKTTAKQARPAIVAVLTWYNNSYFSSFLYSLHFLPFPILFLPSSPPSFFSPFPLIPFLLLLFPLNPFLLLLPSSPLPSSPLPSSPLPSSPLPSSPLPS
jgi:hypothetical protein